MLFDEILKSTSVRWYLSSVFIKQRIKNLLLVVQKCKVGCRFVRGTQHPAVFELEEILFAKIFLWSWQWTSIISQCNFTHYECWIRSQLLEFSNKQESNQSCLYSLLSDDFVAIGKKIFYHLSINHFAIYCFPVTGDIYGGCGLLVVDVILSASWKKQKSSL